MGSMREETLALIEQVGAVLAEYDCALTLRQIFYQLVSRQIIKNSQKMYMKLSRVCVIGRDRGMLPEDKFADRLRQIEKPNCWFDLPDYFDTIRRAYRKDKLRDQNVYIEVWTEKDALREIISSVTKTFDIPLLVVRGQVSRTAIYEAYNRFAEQEESGKNCRLLYLGDFDPSGLAIYESLRERLCNFDEPLLIYFQRIALTPEQIEAYDLPQDPAKTSDTNYKNFAALYGDNVVELDALQPDVLQEIVTENISDAIDIPKFEQAQKIEAEERNQLKKMIGNITG